MASSHFKLPPVSPLMGSSVRAFRETMKGNSIGSEFKTKQRITAAIIGLISPFRWYDRATVLPRARKCDPREKVFIVGHWRGGTTFLHNLLCQATNATFVSTYQTVFPNFMGSKWLFGAIMGKIMPDKRPSDNVKLSVDLPQEEEFALGGVNPHAYYRYMYFPERYNEYYQQAVHFEGLDEEQRANFIRDYRDLLHLAAWKRPGDLLIVKNPVNTARIKLLHNMYPEAKFIHIYRNPYTVFRSTIKFFQALLPTLVFNKISDQFVEDMILDVYVKLYEDFDTSRAACDNLDLVEIRFEDFEQDPLGHLEWIYSTLGLTKFEDSRDPFQTYIDQQKSYVKNAYAFPQELIDKVDQYWGKYVKRWGYSVPE